MNSVPTASRVSAMLEAYRKQWAETVARGERLDLEERQQKSALGRAAEKSQLDHATESEQLRAAEIEQHRVALAQASRRFQSRKERILKAQLNCQKRATQFIQKEDGREVFGFQKGTLDAEKLRKTGIVQAKEALASMIAEVAQGNEAWVKAEDAAQSSFGTFGLFRRCLAPEHPWQTPDLGPDEYSLMKSARAGLAEVDVAAEQMRRQPLSAVFRLLPVWLVGGLLIAGWAVAVFGLPSFGRAGVELPVDGGWGVV